MCIQVDQPEQSAVHQPIPSTPQKETTDSPPAPTPEPHSSSLVQNKTRISELSETLVPPAVEESENLSDHVDSDLSESPMSDSM